VLSPVFVDVSFAGLLGYDRYVLTTDFIFFRNFEKSSSIDSTDHGMSNETRNEAETPVSNFETSIQARTGRRMRVIQCDKKCKQSPDPGA
jgi:hypothetical protein